MGDGGEAATTLKIHMKKPAPMRDSLIDDEVNSFDLDDDTKSALFEDGDSPL